MKKMHPGYIEWLMSENGKEFPAFIISTDTDMGTQGMVSIASTAKKEVIITDLSIKEYKLGCSGNDGIAQSYKLLEQRINKELNRDDLRSIRWLGREGQQEFYTDIYVKDGKAEKVRSEKCDDFIKNGGMVLYYHRISVNDQKYGFVNVSEFDETVNRIMTIRWKCNGYGYESDEIMQKIGVLAHDVDKILPRYSNAEVSGIVYGPGYVDLLVFGKDEDSLNEDIYRVVKLAFGSKDCPYGSSIIRHDFNTDMEYISDKVTIFGAMMHFARRWINIIWKRIEG